MQYVLIIHEVADYAAWKLVFNEAASIRREAGERRYQVLAVDGERNRVAHFSEWTSVAAARAFFESPKLVEIRRAAGVRSPEFVYLNLLEEGCL